MARASQHIALTVHTKDDPIWFDLNRVEKALTNEGYVVKFVDVDWASTQEWRDLESGMPPTGRHHETNVMDHSNVVVQVCPRTGLWVRHILDEDGDVETEELIDDRA